jgi:hypothetical protein
VALFVGLLFGLRRLLPCLKDPRRFGPVLKGIVHGMTGFRTMRAGTTRFTFRESVALRHWFFKTLYE